MEEKVWNIENMYQTWSNNELKLAQIKSELEEKKYNQADIDHILKGYDKFINQKRTQSGFKCMAGGGFFCGLSLMLTFFNVFPDMRVVSLYGLTFIGICVGFFGLYLLLEKRELA